MSDTKRRTGIFYTKDPAGVAMFWRGKEVYRYKNVDELVAAHMKAVGDMHKAQEDSLQRKIASQYTPTQQEE